MKLLHGGSGGGRCAVFPFDVLEAVSLFRFGQRRAAVLLFCILYERDPILRILDVQVPDVHELKSAIQLCVAELLCVGEPLFVALLYVGESIFVAHRSWSIWKSIFVSQLIFLEPSNDSIGRGEYGVPLPFCWL